MLPLFDMLANAQNGKGMELLARQFNLTQQQTRAGGRGAAAGLFARAEAQRLRPLRHRRLHDGAGVSGQHAQIFRGCLSAPSRRRAWPKATAFSAICSARRICRAPSPHRRRRRPASASRCCSRCCRSIASMIMGGLFKQSTNQMQAGKRLRRRQQSAWRDHRADDAARRRHDGRRPAAAAAAASRARPVRQPVRQGAEGHVRRRRGSSRRQPQPQQAPEPGGDNPFGKILQDMLGGGAATPSAPQRGPSPDVATDNPFGKILQDMLGGGVRRTRRRRPIRNNRRPARAPIRADAPRTPMTTFSATCSKPAARPATITRRAWSRCSTSSSAAWTTRASCAWSTAPSWCALPAVA